MHTNRIPSTFIILPELSAHEVIHSDDVETRNRVNDWVDMIKLVFWEKKKSISQVADFLTKRRFRVRLVCERCLQPCGDGYIIDQPAKWTARLFPAMQVGVNTGSCGCRGPCAR